MMKARSDDTMIVPAHLDEFQNKKGMDGIFYLIKNVDKSTCVIIFASTQSITTKSPQLVHNIKTFIRFVVVEKLH